MKKVRIGVVGGNFGCSFYWHEHPNSVVTACCDIREDRRQRMREVYKCDTLYAKFGELVADKNVDAVAVFTPAPLHVWMSVQAMKAGKHVISAVPAAMSLEECEELLAAVKTTGMTYMMAETSRYHPGVMLARDWYQQGKFGTIFYSESEYHHEGLIELFFDERGLPTWRHGFPPMHYPTHCTSMLLGVTGERLTEVTCHGWGDGHEVLETNLYENPFWNEVAMFRTNQAHAMRVAVFWHVASGGCERGQWFGDKLSLFDPTPAGQPAMVGYGVPNIRMERLDLPNFWERLPEPLRHPSGHEGSHTFLTHEFVDAVLNQRRPAVDIYEALAYTAPGIVAHQSALKGGELLKVPVYG